MRGYAAMTVVLVWAASAFPLGAEEKAKTEPFRLGAATLQAPATWERQQATKPFRVLQWGIPAAKGDGPGAEIYVSKLQGDGGGVDANIDRWVGQFQDHDGKPMRDKFEVNGVRFHTVDVAGVYKESSGGPFAGGKVTLRKDYRLLGAVVEIPDDDSIYFIRMTGPKATVGGEVENWSAMLKSATLK